jgi:hypothetical protein
MVISKGLSGLMPRSAAISTTVALENWGDGQGISQEQACALASTIFPYRKLMLGLGIGCSDFILSKTYLMQFLG